MKKEIAFKIEDTSSFQSLTKDYFLGAGFKLKEEHEDQISFVRGSTLLNMVTFNPLKWKSEIVVRLQGDVVAAHFDINTTSQLVTPKEEEFWNLFIENYKVSLTDKIDLKSENERLLVETRKDSWRYVKWAIVGGIVFGIPFGFLAHFTKINTLASVGAAFGAVAFMKYKIDKENKSKVP